MADGKFTIELIDGGTGTAGGRPAPGAAAGKAPATGAPVGAPIGRGATPVGGGAAGAPVPSPVAGPPVATPVGGGATPAGGGRGGGGGAYYTPRGYGGIGPRIRIPRSTSVKLGKFAAAVGIATAALEIFSAVIQAQILAIRAETQARALEFERQPGKAYIAKTEASIQGQRKIGNAIGSAAETAGAGVGTAAGAYFGGPLGAAAGYFIGKEIGKGVGNLFKSINSVIADIRQKNLEEGQKRFEEDYTRFIARARQQATYSSVTAQAFGRYDVAEITRQIREARSQEGNVSKMIDAANKLEDARATRQRLMGQELADQQTEAINAQIAQVQAENKKLFDAQKEAIIKSHDAARDLATTQKEIKKINEDQKAQLEELNRKLTPEPVEGPLEKFLGGLEIPPGRGRLTPAQKLPLRDRQNINQMNIPAFAH